MSGKTSRARRKEAVKAAEDTAYHDIPMPSHFDERQQRIYNEYVEKLSYRKSMFDWMEM